MLIAVCFMIASGIIGMIKSPAALVVALLIGRNVRYTTLCTYFVQKSIRNIAFRMCLRKEGIRNAIFRI